MRYLYVVKKTAGDRGDSPILKLVQAYCKLYGGNDFVICIPGFLGTTKNKVDAFSKKFPTTSKSKNAYFFKGMNGDDFIKVGRTRTTDTIHDYINGLYGNHSSMLPSPLDHSKIAIFFGKEDYNNLVEAEYGTRNIDKLLRQGIVKAILLGSSNQSHNTYIYSPTPKGEADIFLVETDTFASFVENENSDYAADSIYSYLLDDRGQNKRIFAISLSKEMSSTYTLREIVDKLFNFE